MAHLFNGTNDSLEVGSVPVTGVPLTFSCWFKLSATSNQALMALSDATGATERFVLFCNSAGSIATGINVVSSAGGSAVATAAGSPSTGVWQHAAAVCASTTSRIAYFNGTASAENTASVTPAAMTKMNVGARLATSLGLWFSGDLAEVSVYNAALTAAEILSLSKRYRPDRIRPQNLVYYDRLIRTPQDLRGGRLITQLGTGTTPSPHPAILFP